MSDYEMMLYLLSKLGRDGNDFSAEQLVWDPEKTRDGSIYDAPKEAKKAIEFRTNGFYFDEDGNLIDHYAFYD